MLPLDADLSARCERVFGVPPSVEACTLDGVPTLHVAVALAGAGAARGVELTELPAAGDLGAWAAAVVAETRAGAAAPVALCVTAPAAPDPATLLPLLSREKVTRASGFVHPADRATFVTAHALKRHLLAAWLATANAATLDFARLTCPCGARDHGKPCLAPAPTRELDLPVHFSLSHTRGAVAVLVAGVPCGVDLEPEMSEASARAVRDQLPPTERDATGNLTAAWVRKEALGKLVGTGIVVR